MKTISGTMKSDHIKGGPADNILYGYRGDDVLKGGSGDDILFGDEGQDVMRGGPGRDIFVFSKSYSPFEAGVFDIITDFKPGKDSLVMIDYDVGAPGSSFPLTEDNFADFFTYECATLSYLGKPVAIIDPVSFEDVLLLS